MTKKVPHYAMLLCVDGLVGRQRELDTLERAFSRAARGVGGLVLLTGDAGMGKSRLLEAFIDQRREGGHEVWLGQCWEAGGAPSYWPWTQALRSLSRSLGMDRVRERLGARAGQLRAVLPELASELDDAGTEDPERARFQVFDAVGELLTEAAFDGPVCVALEDLHASDESTLLLLEFLARATPALIVGTYREKEATRRSVGTLLARVARRGRLVPLSPLSAPEVAAVLEGSWGRPVPNTIVAQVFRSSEGNPLFVSELERRLRADPEAGLALESRGIPAGIEATIAAHVSELDSATTEVLEAAAVVGRDFEAGVLTSVLGQDDAAVVSALGRACDADLLLRMSSGYRFSHFMHRAVLYRGIEASRRSRLHLSVAEVLRNAAEPTGVPWSTLAHHLFAAGLPAREQAIEAASEAAWVATRRRAFADAAALLARAIETVRAVPSASQTLLLDLQLRLGQAQIDADQTVAGRQTCETAAESARALGDEVGLARAALTYGTVFDLGVVNPRLLGLLEEALAGLGDAEPGLRAQLMARHAAAQQPAPDPRLPIQLARDAVALARRTGDARVLEGTIRGAVSAMMDLGDPAERIELNREYIELARRRFDPGEMMRGHQRLIIDALELGDRAALDDHLDQLTRTADEQALPHFQWRAYGLHAVRALLQGRTKTAERWSTLMRLYGERAGDPNVSLTCVAYELGALRMARRDAELLARLEDVGLHAMGKTWGVEFLLALRASTLVRLGRHEEALALLTDGLLEKLLGSCDAMNTACVGEVVAHAGDDAMVARVLSAIECSRGRCISWGVLGMSWDGAFDRVLGLLEARLGRRDDATRSFDAAMMVCRQMDAPLHLGLVEEDRARLVGASVPASPGRDASAPIALVRRGETWTVGRPGGTLVFKDTRGMGMLARLLDAPGQELHVLDLSGSPGAPREEGAPMLDAQARDAYRRRAEHLRAELAEAEGWNDTARAEKARAELDALSGELAAAVGLGGRSRRTHSTVERARVNVQRRIKDALRRISDQDETLGRQLARRVRTGTYCVYEPD